MRNRLKIKDLRFTILIIFFTLFINHQSLIINQAFAAESTNSASQSADLKSKLKLLQEEIASRAAGMKSEITKKLQNKAYVGTVKSKNSNSLVLSVRNSEKNINVSEFTEYVIKSKKSTGNQGLKNITIDSAIACLGDIDDKGTLTAKRIIKLNSPPPVFPKIINGIIASVSNGKAKLQTTRNDQFSIVFDKNTEYQIGKTGGSFDDIRTNKWIIVSGQGSDSANLSANYVYIYPGALTVKPKPATQSAAPVKK